MLRSPQRKTQEDIVDSFQLRTELKEAQLPILTPLSSEISLYSRAQISSVAGIIEVTRTLSSGDATNDYGTVNSPFMGAISLIDPCERCHKIDCPGHPGIIKFHDFPIVHPGFTVALLRFLKCICKDCGHALITPKVMKREGFDILSGERLLRDVSEYCYKQKLKCRQQLLVGKSCSPNPTYENGNIKKTGEVRYSREGVSYTFPIPEIVHLLKQVPTADAAMLGFPDNSHQSLIQEDLPVPPTIARPPDKDGSVVHHDQLTIKYNDIYKEIEALRQPNSDRKTVRLFKLVRSLFHKTDKRATGGKDFLSVMERLQGKNQYVRGGAMGKRVGQCGRTVAGPDASLRFGQIRLPKVWAPRLTKPVRVTRFNQEALTKLLRQGRVNWVMPRGVSLLKPINNRNRSWYQLNIGDIAVRWLQNGDRVVINRQPTLHKYSMMSYEVILNKALTIGNHASATTPPNLDFDGDEQNCWNPQDFEVEAEAELLLHITENILSQEQNRPIMGMVMNSVTGSYLLSDPKTRMSYGLFNQLMELLDGGGADATLQTRLEEYGTPVLSGRAAISALFPPDFYYNQKGILMIDGVLISGKFKKASIGTSDRSVIHDMHKLYGPERTSRFFTEAPWLINKWLKETGFSVGLADMLYLGVDKYGREYDKSKVVTDAALAQVREGMEALDKKLDDPLEEKLRQKRRADLLNVAGATGSKLAQEVFTDRNSLGVMIGSEAKGTNANVGQMIGFVAQQNYRGKPLQPKLTGGQRILPTFDLNDESPEANGFVVHSFIEGLTVEELWYIMTAGREGLTDTALKTADTGTIQRRLIKALENYVLGYDGSVRNTAGMLFAPNYNGGFDISQVMSVDDGAGGKLLSFCDLKALIEAENIKRGWLTTEMRDKIALNRKLAEKQPADYRIPVRADDNETRIEIKPTELVQAEYSEVPRTQLTRFERARLVGTRAMQLALDDEPRVDVNSIKLEDVKRGPDSLKQGSTRQLDALKIALAEYHAGVLPLTINRQLPGNIRQEVMATKDNLY